MATEGNLHRQVKNFNGEGEKAGDDCRKRNSWMRAYLGKGRIKGTAPEAFGEIVFITLDGKAADALDQLEVDARKVDGNELIFDILDARFPRKADRDRIGEVLDEVFNLKAQKHEATAFHRKVHTDFQ